MSLEPDEGAEALASDIPRNTSSRFLRNTATMSVGITLSRLTGFLRLSAMAFAIGVAETRLADAYNVANNTPNIVYELVLGGVLTSVFVPVFVEWLQQHGRKEANEVARRVFTLATIVLTVIMLVGIVAAPVIVRLYTLRVTGPGAEAERALATFFLRWFMPQIVFYGIGAIANGLLNANGRFAATMFAPILNNVIVIGTFLAFAAMHGPGVPTPDGLTTAQRYVLALGTTAGVIAMTLALWPSLRKTGFRFAWRPDATHPAVRRIGKLASWTFLYVAANQLGLFVVIVLAAGARGYTVYFDAFILFQLPHAIFAVAIFTALLPAMSSRWVAGDRDGFRNLLSQGLRATGFVLIPAAFGYMVLAVPIVRLVIQHGGATTPQDASRVADALVFFSFGLFSYSAFQLLLRAFYAMQDSKTPALINVASFVVNTATNLLFFFALGLEVRGLALGLAAAYTFASVVAVLILRRRLGGMNGREIVRGLTKVLAAGVVTAAAAWLTSRLMESALGVSTVLTQGAQVLLSVAIGLLVFVAMALLLRMEELSLITTSLRSRFRR
ncbi:MAG: murein biosynthesis integral membrane protein MurJ [Actinomycetota bacterium]